jgi:hypothetical protein
MGKDPRMQGSACRYHHGFWSCCGVVVAMPVNYTFANETSFRRSAFSAISDPQIEQGFLFQRCRGFHRSIMQFGDAEFVWSAPNRVWCHNLCATSTGSSSTEVHHAGSSPQR